MCCFSSTDTTVSFDIASYKLQHHYNQPTQCQYISISSMLKMKNKQAKRSGIYFKSKFHPPSKKSVITTMLWHNNQQHKATLIQHHGPPFGKSVEHLFTIGVSYHSESWSCIKCNKWLLQSSAQQSIQKKCM